MKNPKTKPATQKPAPPTKSKKPRQKKDKLSDKTTEAIALQSLLLGTNELLLYKDEEGEYHVLCKDEYNPKKDYQVIYLTYKDIQD